MTTAQPLPLVRAFGSAGLVACAALGLPSFARADVRLEGCVAKPAAFYPSQAVVVDVDQDGDADVVTGSSTTSSLRILRNDGTGVLADPMPIASGPNPRAVAAADFTGDGWIDLIACCDLPNTLRLMPNNSSGGFLAPVTIAQNSYGLVLRAADLNADGAPDLVLARYHPLPYSVEIYLNQGGGTFGPPSAHVVSGYVFDVRAGDLDGNGSIDLIAAGEFSGGPLLLRNQGSGTFDAPVSAGLGGGVYVTLVDYDTDGDLDVAASGVLHLRVFPNNGDATFGTSVSFPCSRRIASLETGDVDGDGNPDVVALPSDYPSELVVFGSQGGFAAFAPQPTTYQPSVLGFADMDGDGDEDFVVPSGAGGTVAVHENLGTGLYSHSETIALGAGAGMVVSADLDGDGRTDLLTTGGGLRVLLATGSDTFAPPVFYDIAGVQTSIACHDFDGDGDVDVATSNGTQGDLAVLLNTGAGALSAPSFHAAGSNALSVVAADLDGDGDGDLASANYDSNNVSILMNSGAAVFGAPTHFGLGTNTSPIALASADIEGDGDVDLVCANHIGQSVSILRNSGGGAFVPGPTLAAGTRPTGIVAADIDADGDIDIAVCNRGYSDTFYVYTVSLYRNSGTGTFTTYTHDVGALPRAIGCANLDVDAGLEVFTANSFGNTLSVLDNLGNFTFAYHREHVVGTFPAGLTTLDLGGDGDLDVVTADSASATLTILRNAGATGTAYCAGDGSSVPCPCGNDSAPAAQVGCLNSSGAGGALRGLGSALIVDDQLVLNADGLTGSLALFFQGNSATPPTVFDDGIGCVGGGIIRLGSRPVSLFASWYPMPGDPPIHERGLVPATGGTRYYQCYYRNALPSFCPPGTTNRTNALRIVWRP